MVQYASSPFWQNIDVSKISENWKTDIAGASRRLGAAALAPQIVASGINNLLGQTAHTSFAMATSSVAGTYKWPADANTTDPLYEIKVPDWHIEATNYFITILAFPPEPDQNWANSSNTYISTNAFGGGQTANAVYGFNASSQNFYGEMVLDVIELPRGAASNADVTAQVSIFGGYRIMDMAIIEQPALTLDSTMGHGFAEPSLAKAANPLVDDIAEQCRDQTHKLRTRALPPVVTWSAQKGQSAWTVGSSPGDQLGMVVDQTSDGTNQEVNLLDHAFTSRNADSPGVTDYAYRQGIGPEDSKNGTTVRREVHIFASSTNNDCNAHFIAETAWGRANIIVATASATDPAWVELRSDVIVNSTSDEVGATEQAAKTNKIDLFGSVNQGALHVFAISIYPKIPQTA